MKPNAVAVRTMACLALCAAVGQAKVTKTVQVDCSKNGSINAALQNKSDELIVEISGICKEAVVLERDNVTLVGVPSAVIESPGPAAEGGLPQTPLTVREAERFVVENLTLRGGAWGVRVRGSSYDRPDPVTSASTVGRLVNCWVVDNESVGVTVYDSYLELDGVSMSGNGTGIFVQRGWVSGTGNVIEDNSSWAIQANVGAIVRLEQTQVSALGAAGGGLVLNNSSSIYLTDGSTLLAGDGGQAVQAGPYSYVLLQGNGANPMLLSGGLLAYDRGMIWLVWTTQTGVPSAVNWVGYEAHLEAFRSTLEGDLRAEGFGRAILQSATQINGQLLCGAAGDAWIDNSVTVTGGISGCEHAP